MKSVVNLKAPAIEYFERTRLVSDLYEDMRKHKPLTEEEEQRVFKIYIEGTSDEKIQARDTIVNANMRFVVAIAKRFGTNDNLLDLINEGATGLIDAIDSFNPNSGNRFISYAVWYIRRAINQYQIQNGELVRKNNIQKTYYLVNQITQTFVQKYERHPTCDEVAQILDKEYGVKIKNSRDLLKNQYVLIDAPIDEENGSGITNLTAYQTESSKYNEYEDTATKDALKLKVKSLMRGLTPKERDVISYFYGIGHDREYALQEIGPKIGMSQERARQLKESALEKMRSKEFAKVY